MSQNDTLMCNTQEAQSRKGTGPSKTTDTETKQLAPPNRGREVESDDEIEVSATQSVYYKDISFKQLQICKQYIFFNLT